MFYLPSTILRLHITVHIYWRIFYLPSTILPPSPYHSTYPMENVLPTVHHPPSVSISQYTSTRECSTYRPSPILRLHITVHIYWRIFYLPSIPSLRLHITVHIKWRMFYLPSIPLPPSPYHNAHPLEICLGKWCTFRWGHIHMNVNVNSLWVSRLNNLKLEY